MDIISEFLDHSVHWSLPDACGFTFQNGSLRLAKRVMVHEAIKAEKADEIVTKEAKARAKMKSKSRVIVPHDINANLVLHKRHDSFFQQRQFTHAMAKAAARGDLSVVKWLVQQFPAGIGKK